MPLSDLVGFVRILQQAGQTLFGTGCAAFVPEHLPRMVALIVFSLTGNWYFYRTSKAKYHWLNGFALF